MLDADLAEIYQVETKRLNEAVKRKRTENRIGSRHTVTAGSVYLILKPSSAQMASVSFRKAS